MRYSIQKAGAKVVWTENNRFPKYIFYDPQKHYVKRIRSSAFNMPGLKYVEDIRMM